METVSLVCELADKYKDSLLSQVSKLKHDHLEINRGMDVFKLVQEWKYSKGILYTPFKFFNELMGYGQGRMVKKNFQSPLEGRLQGLECAGFFEKKLCLMIDSAKGGENARLTMSRIEEKEGAVVVKRSHHYDFTKSVGKEAEFVSLALVARLSDRFELSAGLSVRGDFGLKFFEYGSDGSVDCVYVYGTGFHEPIRHQFYYDWRGLLRITVPSKKPKEESIVWQRRH
jgi:hypothetical protein